MSRSGFSEEQSGNCGDTQNCVKNEGTLALIDIGTIGDFTVYHITVFLRTSFVAVPVCPETNQL